MAYLILQLHYLKGEPVLQPADHALEEFLLHELPQGVRHQTLDLVLDELIQIGQYVSRQKPIICWHIWNERFRPVFILQQ